MIPKKSKHKYQNCGIIQNESCSTRLVASNTVFKPYPSPKIGHQGPKKSKRTQKLSQNQISELNEPQKIKVVQLHEQTTKQLSNPTPTPQTSPLGPNRDKKDSKIKISEFRESQKIKVVQLHKWKPKIFLSPTLNLKIAHQGPKKTKRPQN